MWIMARSIFEYACEKNLLVFLALIVLTCIICYCIRIFERSQDQNNTKFNWLGEKIAAVDNKVVGLIAKVDDHSEKILAHETVLTKWDKILETKYQKEGTKNAS